jgi:hypothetical protein
VGLTFAIPYLPQHNPEGITGVLRWLPAVLVPFCALFMIRGYAISDESVIIQRVFWSNRIPCSEVVNAYVDANAMKGAMRICGNGGFFTFAGFYRSQALGSFRAFVTDLRCPVVLTTNKKTYVLSPSDPEAFVKDLALKPKRP